MMVTKRCASRWPLLHPGQTVEQRINWENTCTTSAEREDKMLVLESKKLTGLVLVYGV